MPFLWEIHIKVIQESKENNIQIFISISKMSSCIFYYALFKILDCVRIDRSYEQYEGEFNIISKY